jgi:hypothetical protein
MRRDSTEQLLNKKPVKAPQEQLLPRRNSATSAKVTIEGCDAAAAHFFQFDKNNKAPSARLDGAAGKIT